MTEPLDLDVIRARCEAATSGSWTTGAGHEPGWKPHELIIAPTYPLIELDDSEQGRADAEFIAHARTDVPMLLAEVERLAARLAEYAPDRPGSPTYDMLAKAFGDLIDERSEWERVVREMGADIERLTAERDAALSLVEQRDADLERLRAEVAELRRTSQQSIDARDRLLYEATADRDRLRAAYRDLAELERVRGRLEAAWQLGDEQAMTLIRYRAVVERVRQVTGKWHQTTNDDPWATIGLVSAAGEILNALSATETSGVDSGTSEPRSALHGDAGPADEAVAAPSTWALPDELRGDGPCGDCGTLNNIVWFTESVLWNDVVRRDDSDAILCIPCFVKRVDAIGYHPTGWRLLPDWHWETKTERLHRLTDATGETLAGGAVSVSSEGRQLEWLETEDGPVLVPPAGEYQITCGVHGILSQRYATDDDGYGAALRKAESHRQRCVGTVGVEFVPGEATDV